MFICPPTYKTPKVMKKSLNIVFFICLFFNISTVGQIVQRNFFLAVEFNNVPSTQFTNSSSIVEINFDNTVEVVSLNKEKTPASMNSYMLNDFNSLLDRKPSLERAISLKKVEYSNLKPIHTIDYQHHEFKNVDLRITTLPLFKTSRNSKSFGPVYEF